MTRNTKGLMSLATMAAVVLIPWRASTGQELKSVAELSELGRVVILPVEADYYLGPPNLHMAFEYSLSFYESPEVYKERFDEDSDRIAKALSDSMLVELTDLSIDARTLDDGLNDQTVRGLHAAYWPAMLYNQAGDESGKDTQFRDAGWAARSYVSARRENGAEPLRGSDVSDSDRAMMTEEIAARVNADTLLIARFWGWRKKHGGIPLMGYTKSAAHLWVVFVDGKTGDLVAAGNGGNFTQVFVVDQSDKKIRKMVSDAFSSMLTPAPADRTGKVDQ